MVKKKSGKSNVGFKMVNADNVSNDIENILNDDADDDDGDGDGDKNNLLSMLGLKKAQTHKHEDALHGKKGFKQQLLPLSETINNTINTNNINNNNNSSSNSNSNKYQKTKPTTPNPNVKFPLMEIEDDFPDNNTWVKADGTDGTDGTDAADDIVEIVEKVENNQPKYGLYKPSYLK